MICSKPWVRAGNAFACGQCLPCRINHKRIWTHRIMLEANQHASSVFVTLTYDDAHLPPGGTLVPRDMTLFLKRLRERFAPETFRYFYVGEYGDETQRPHYHAVIFGYPGCLNGRSIYSHKHTRCCSPCETIKAAWGHGHIFVGECTPESANYVSGYCTKKLTKKDDERLGGRYPEFSRMSRRPALGTDAMWEVASTLLTHDFEKLLPDVPGCLRHGRKIMPLGRTLTRKLRTFIGRDEKCPEAQKAIIQAKMQPLRDAAKAVTSAPGMSRFRDFAIYSAIIRESEGRAIQMAARHRHEKKKRHL